MQGRRPCPGAGRPEGGDRAVIGDGDPHLRGRSAQHGIAGGGDQFLKGDHRRLILRYSDAELPQRPLIPKPIDGNGSEGDSTLRRQGERKLQSILHGGSQHVEGRSEADSHIGLQRGGNGFQNHRTARHWGRIILQFQVHQHRPQGVQGGKGEGERLACQIIAGQVLHAADAGGEGGIRRQGHLRHKGQDEVVYPKRSGAGHQPGRTCQGDHGTGLDRFIKGQPHHGGDIHLFRAIPRGGAEQTGSPLVAGTEGGAEQGRQGPAHQIPGTTIGDLASRIQQFPDHHDELIGSGTKQRLERRQADQPGHGFPGRSGQGHGGRHRDPTPGGPQEDPGIIQRGRVEGLTEKQLDRRVDIGILGPGRGHGGDDHREGFIQHEVAGIEDFAIGAEVARKTDQPSSGQQGSRHGETAHRNR